MNEFFQKENLGVFNLKLNLKIRLIFEVMQKQFVCFCRGPDSSVHIEYQNVMYSFGFLVSIVCCLIFLGNMLSILDL